MTTREKVHDKINTVRSMICGCIAAIPSYKKFDSEEELISYLVAKGIVNKYNYKELPFINVYFKKNIDTNCKNTIVENAIKSFLEYSKPKHFGVEYGMFNSYVGENHIYIMLENFNLFILEYDDEIEELVSEIESLIDEIYADIKTEEFQES